MVLVMGSVAYSPVKKIKSNHDSVSDPHKKSFTDGDNGGKTEQERNRGRTVPAMIRNQNGGMKNKTHESIKRSTVGEAAMATEKQAKPEISESESKKGKKTEESEIRTSHDRGRKWPKTWCPERPNRSARVAMNRRRRRRQSMQRRRLNREEHRGESAKGS